jgi:hypothetical protein
MRSLLRIGLASGLLGAASALAQSPQPQMPYPNPPTIPWANKFFLPDIDKNPTQTVPNVIVKNFGTLPKGSLAVHRFTITNIYDVPMQVTHIRRSCECLKAFPPQRVLQPNESTEFAVTMDTSQFTGPNAQSLFVTFGPQHYSTAVLRFETVSRADVMLSPGSAQFGTILQGNKATQTVTLEYSGKQTDWRLTEVLRPRDDIDIEVKEASRGFLGVKYQISVTLKAGFSAGLLSEQINLKTNDPQMPIVTMNLSGNILAPVTLSKDRIQFGKVKVGEVKKENILARGSEPFTFEAPAIQNASLQIQTFPAALPVQVVTVAWEPTKPGPFREEITLKSSLRDSSVKIIIEGEAE